MSAVVWEDYTKTMHLRDDVGEGLKRCIFEAICGGRMKEKLKKPPSRNHVWSDWRGTQTLDISSNV